MAYCDEDDVIALLIGRREENRNETPAELDVDQIRDAIADAEAQVNLALKRRYVIPFVDGAVPDTVKRLTANIAAYLPNAQPTFHTCGPRNRREFLALRSIEGPHV